MRNVAVLMGGTSNEHEVSVWSGERVLESLDRRRYRPSPVLIQQDGGWVVDGRRAGDSLEGVLALREAGVDVAFLALHGPFGEDGTIQALLEAAGVPFTGSRAAASSLCADKIQSKRLVAGAGFDVAPDRVLPPETPASVEAELGFPLFVKNPYEGSSLGVRRVTSSGQLATAVRELAPGCDRLLVEAVVPGRELTVAILDDEEGRPEALPVAEIVAAGAHFDFRNKYTPGVAQELVPAPLEPALSRRVQQIALEIHALLALEAMSRTDFILSPEGRFVFLETNSIPGLTPTSLLPLAAGAAGLSFQAVLTRLVEGAMRTMRPWSGSSKRSGARSTGSSTATTAERN